MLQSHQVLFFCVKYKICYNQINFSRKNKKHMNLFTIYNTPPLVSAILFLILGVLVYLKNKKSIVNATFLLVCAMTFLWQFSWFLLFSTENESVSKILVKIGWVGIVFIPVTFYHFFVSFLGIKKLGEKIVLYFSYTIAFVFVGFLLLSNIFINGYSKSFWGHYPRAGFLHPFFLLFLTLLTLRIIYLLYMEMKHETKGARFYQLKFVFWALIFYVLSSIDFVVNYGANFYPFGFIFIIIFLGIFSYTIIAHRLMDVRLVLRKSTVFVFSLVTILIPAFIAKYFFDKYLGSISVWLDFGILIVGIVGYPFTKNYFFGIANKYFFSSLYDSQKVIAEVSDRLRMIMDITKVYDFIYETLLKTFHTKTFAVISYDKEKKEYIVQYNKGIKAKKNDVFRGNDFLHRYFIEQNKAIIVDEVKKMYYNNHTKKILDFLTKLNVSILAPLNVKGKTIGLLVLGPKESGDMYNDEDFQVLEIIGAQAAVSIDNSRLYSEVKDFNEKLEQKVEDATVELRSTNSELKDMNEKLVTAYEKLHQLDRAKTEFISIASHQLRTPLTSIKGFISLLLDGTYGRIPKVTRDVLEKVFISNERLIKLVEDLLNISRIESGKLVFRFEKNDITKLAKDVVDSFELAAKNKKLKLEYRAPKKKIPAIYFDNDKMREVISNLVDNSIKYTKKGTVGVTVEELNNQVRVIISDSGMGIAKEEIRYIFEKFQRGKDSSTTHTEGVGLGLYVCEKIINSHNGKIWAESDGLEKGSRFIIGLNIDFIPEDSLKVIGKEGK